MKRYLGLIFIIVLLFSSCIYYPDKQNGTKKDNTVHVSINELYSIDLPGDFKERDDLNDEASLQYGGKTRELYIIILDEDIKTFHQTTSESESELSETDYRDLAGFAQYTYKQFKERSNLTALSDFAKISINGSDALQIEAEAEVDGTEIYYLLTYAAGRDDYYQIIAWTLKQKKDRYKKTMIDMVNTFAELPI